MLTRERKGGVAVNGRLGGRVSYLANSGLTQRRLHAVFDLATPIVPIFPVPEDYQVDSERRHVLFVAVARTGGAGTAMACLPHILFKSARAGAMRTSSFEIFAGPPTPFQTSPGCRRPITCASPPGGGLGAEPSRGNLGADRQRDASQRHPPCQRSRCLARDGGRRRGVNGRRYAARRLVRGAGAVWDERACYDRLAAAAQAAAMRSARAGNGVGSVGGAVPCRRSSRRCRRDNFRSRCWPAIARTSPRQGRRGGVAFGQVDFDIFALADAIDTVETEGVQGVLNGLTLRIEDAIF